MEITTQFSDLGISSEILRAVEEMGYTTPSPIQSQAIPFVLEGRDLIGQAQTGTGKTAAFAISKSHAIFIAYQFQYVRNFCYLERI